MDNLEKDISLTQALADYEMILALVEPTLSEWSALVSDNSKEDDPLRLLIGMYLERWRKLRIWVDRKADADYGGLLQEIGEIGNWLPGMATTKPPFPGSASEGMMQLHQTAGFSDEEVSEIMAGASRPDMGAPRNRREIALEALRMKNQRKSYREIADALCDCGNHRRLPIDQDRRLSPCADRYRGQIRELRAVLRKYARCLPD
jgi:hypothetical protein